LALRFINSFGATRLEMPSVDTGILIGAGADMGQVVSNNKYLINDVDNMLIIWGSNPIGFTRPGETSHMMISAKERGAKIVCCEQYHRYPILAAGLEAVRRGAIGTPRSACISLAHDYHAASLLRRALMIGRERYEMRGSRQVSPAVNTDSRYGAILDGSVTEEVRDRVLIDYESGKTAIYDFAPLQYRSYIRARHFTVRGDRGEWSDTTVYGLDGQNAPFRKALMPEIPERYRCLDTQYLRDLRKTWRPELFLDTLQDEYAIATILLDMGDYLRGGESPYPLWEAVEDARFWLRLREAVEATPVRR
jgi:predicted dehydrogenase